MLDPQVTPIDFNDNLIFTATRWELHEGSLVSVPADASATIRSMGGGHDRQLVADVQARMLARHRISLRQAMYDDQSALDD